MDCLLSVTYTMQADIYKPSISQDSSGAAVKTYIYEKTVPCFARTNIRAGSGDNSTVVNLRDYINYLNSIIKMRTQEKIPLDRKVVKIRNHNGIIWQENEDQTSAGGFQGSTIFEVRGSTPIINFDGSVIEYDIMLMRQESQVLAWKREKWILAVFQKKY